MTARSFLDTNVLLYAYDPADPVKSHIAVELLDRMLDLGSGVVSAQVLAEFFSIATRKLKMPAQVAQARVGAFAETFLVVAVTGDVVQEAIRLALRFQINFWDAQVLAAARASGVSTILSEDLQHGAELEGIRILNPFRRDS